MTDLTQKPDVDVDIADANRPVNPTLGGENSRLSSSHVRSVDLENLPNIVTDGREKLTETTMITILFESPVKMRVKPHPKAPEKEFIAWVRGTAIQSGVHANPCPNCGWFPWRHLTKTENGIATLRCNALYGCGKDWTVTVEELM